MTLRAAAGRAGSGASALPAIFVSHRASTLAFEAVPAQDFLRELGGAMRLHASYTYGALPWTRTASTEATTGRWDTGVMMRAGRDFSAASRRSLEGGAAIRRARVAGAVLLLTGCSGVDVERTLYPNQLAFDCRDGKVMQVTRAADGRSATVTVEGRTLALSRADSAAEEKYTDGAYTLYLDRERGLLENNGKVVYGPCQSQAPLPTAPRRSY
jgi:membrane-bound inhibitor of C-type lysozyme